MPWSTDDLRRLVEVEAQLQNVDPRLALAVAEQESKFDPRARSPKGATGVMQLMPGTAKQLGVTIDDPADNIRGGVTYLKQQLDAFGGDQGMALAAYNAGPEVVKAYGKVPPYKETQGYVSRILGMLAPASAEAATPQAHARSRLDEIEAELARRDAQPSVGGTPPAARPQTPAAPNVAPGGRQGPATPALERFTRLRSTQEAAPAVRQRRQEEFLGLPPALQEEYLRGEEATQPAEASSDLTVPIEKVSPSAPRSEADRLARVREELAAWEQQAGRPWREGDPRMPSEKRLGVPDEAPVEEGITAPSTMIPLLMPGAGLKLASPLLTSAAPFVQRLARPVAEGLSQTAGWTAGRTAETGQVPSPAEIGTEAALNIATGGVVEIPGAVRDAKRALLRSTPGAQTLLKQQAVKEAEGLGSRVFAPQDKAVVSRVFDEVAATGEKLDVQPVRDYWKSLIPDERRIAARELKAINPRFAEEMINPRFQGWDIGELQDLRSHLLKASTTRKNPATQDLLQGMRGSVDDAMTQAMSKGSLAAEQLTQAQAAWRKVKQAEDLQGMVTKHTRESPNLQWQELNLAALSKDVHGGGSKAARKVMEGMSKTEREVLQQELESLKRHYPFVRVNDTASRVIGGGSLLTAGGLALTGNLPGAVAALLPVIVTAASRSPTVMSLFKRSIIEGKGRLAQHHVDALLNAIRHENEGEPPAQ